MINADSRYLEAPTADGPVGAGGGQHAVIYADSRICQVQIMIMVRVTMIRVPDVGQWTV